MSIHLRGLNVNYNQQSVSPMIVVLPHHLPPNYPPYILLNPSPPLTQSPPVLSYQASNKQASGSGGQQASKHVFNADLGKKASRNLLVSKADVNYDRLLASPHPPHTYTPPPS